MGLEEYIKYSFWLCYFFARDDCTEIEKCYTIRKLHTKSIVCWILKKIFKSTHTSWLFSFFLCMFDLLSQIRSYLTIVKIGGYFISSACVLASNR